MRAFYLAVILVGVGVGAVAAYLAANRPSEPVQNGEFVSGPQVGSKLPGPFEPFNINGADAGDERCLYCKYGNSPVVMIFASKPSDLLAKLVTKIEKAATDAKGDVGACVVVTDTSDATKTELSKLAGKENLKHVVLGMVDPKQLKNYALHPDAETTVLLYSKQVVRVNRALKAGELSVKAIAEIADEAAKHYSGK